MRRERPDALIQHIHHQALRGIGQRPGEKLRQHKGRTQIGFHMAVPGIPRRVMPFIAFEGGGVVHQHAKRTECLGGVRDQLGDLGLHTQFGLERDGAPTKRANFGSGGFSGIGAAGVVDGDIKAGFSQCKRQGAAKPLASAGDQRGRGEVGGDHVGLIAAKRARAYAQGSDRCCRFPMAASSGPPSI